MRVAARFCAIVAVAWSAWTATPTWADPVAQFDSEHHFVVVTFSNDPYRPASRAGTTGRRYSGDSYGIAQNAHDNAQRVASIYSLRQVASWPIKELGVHCVVYEIPDSRPVSDVLARLSKDPRIPLPHPLQQFHTLTSQSAPLSYNDPLFGLQNNLVSLGISA